MKNKGFPLIELLAVIVILGVILTITIPIVSGVIKSSMKQTFIIDTKNILETISAKRMGSIKFDPTLINELTIESLLDIPNSNYESITVTLVADKVHIIIVGKNKWAGFTTCGTIDEVLGVGGSRGVFNNFYYFFT